MRDLTEGSIQRHLLQMAVPIAAGMLMQTLYLLVDLYFVARLGDAAIAGVAAAANVMMIVVALTQMLSVGTVALVSQAAGHKDQAEANLAFNQSLALAALCAVATLAGGYALARPYMQTVGAGPATVEAGVAYLYCFLPGLALQFALVVMGSGLRGTGIVKPTMVVQMATVLLNILLAPVLIAGWGTGVPLGVAGAGLASTISVVAGVLLLWTYFRRLEHYVALDPSQWRPRLPVWRRMLNIGLPAGGEFLLMFVIMAVIYWAIRDFGAAAQAGFGIGMRVMQAIFLPAMALGFAASPIVGQNYGARHFGRVRETFHVVVTRGSLLMLVLTLFCQWRPDLLIAAFTREPEVIAVGTTFLRIISLNFVASGLVFTCSGIFQGLGYTWPAFASTASRLVTFVLPAVWLAHWPGHRLEQVWELSVASVWLQAATSLFLLRVTMHDRLAPQPA
jgi:putative MATE family efflux protein